MAAVVPENRACFDGGNVEFSNNVDFSEVDSALLMSILDDTQGVGEDYDDERLRSVIQSLEAEIDGHTAVDDYDLFKDDSSHHLQSFDDSDNFKNQHYFSELGALDDFMEMEMEIESSFSMPNEGSVVNSWFVDYPNCENHGMVEDGDGYGYLWHETKIE